MDFATWTKQDFIDFDAKREEVFAPTQIEIDAQKQKHKQDIIDKVQSILSVYNINFTWEETDFKDLYSLYIKWDWTNTNQSMAERIGDESILNDTTKELWTYHNTLADFCNFVLQYE